jgi:hypothetical protein
VIIECAIAALLAHEHQVGRFGAQIGVQSGRIVQRNAWSSASISAEARTIGYLPGRKSLRLSLASTICTPTTFVSVGAPLVKPFHSSSVKDDLA